MNNYILYVHTSKSNHKKYIGITNSMERRWRSNGIEYKPHKYEKLNRPFWNAIMKYGFDGFNHEVLVEALSFEEACELEKQYIEKFNTTNRKYGYNLSKGGNGGLIYDEHPKGMKGKKQTENQIKGHSLWASNNENNCMTNGKVKWGKTHEHPRGMKGKTHSDEYKKRLSEMMSNNSPNFKKCFAILPSGEMLEFKSPKFLCEHFNIPSVSSSIYISMKKEPYKVKPGSHTKRFDLEGIMIKFENQ